MGACCELPPGSRVGTFEICLGLPDGPARAAISASAIYTQKSKSWKRRMVIPKLGTPFNHQTNKRLSDCTDPTRFDQTTLSDSRYCDSARHYFECVPAAANPRLQPAARAPEIKSR